MVSFRDAFRQGREQARAARGAPPLGRHEWDAGGDSVPDPGNDAGVAGGDPQATSNVQLEERLRQRDDELAETKRLLGEMADYAETMEARVIELIVGAEAMAKALLLPGVKTYLLQKFHPDKYPDANAEQHELLTAALKTINAAYSRATSELQTSESSPPAS